MSARPCLDWSPVGLCGHPIPGNADEVLRGAREFRQTEQNLKHASNALKKLTAADVTESDALDELDGEMAEIVAQLEKVVDRYELAADALSTYAPLLLKAQQDAERALETAAASRRERDQAANQATDFRNQALLNFDPAQRRELIEGHSRAKGQMHLANAALLDAKGKVEDAIADAKAANDRAADAIQTAMSTSGLKDSLLDKIGEVVDVVVIVAKAAVKAYVDFQLALAKAVWENLDLIALFVTAVGFLLLVTPFAAAAPAVFMAGRAIAAVATAQSALKLTKAVVEKDPDTAARESVSLIAGLVGGKALKRIFGKVGRIERTSLTKRAHQHKDLGYDKTRSLIIQTRESTTLQKLSELANIRGDRQRRIVDGLSHGLGEQMAKVPATIDIADAGMNVLIGDRESISRQVDTFRECLQPAGAGR